MKTHETETCIHLINLHVKLIAFCFEVLCLNVIVFFRTNSYVCTTRLLSVYQWRIQDLTLGGRGLYQRGEELKIIESVEG